LTIPIQTSPVPNISNHSSSKLSELFEVQAAKLTDQIRSKLGSDIFWAAMGKILSIVFGLVAIRILTEYVSKDVFGSVSLVVAGLTLVTTTLFQPISQSLLKFIPVGVDLKCRQELLEFAKKLNLYASITAMSLAVVGWLIGCLPISSLALVGAIGLIGVDSFRMFYTSVLSADREQKSLAFWSILDSVGRPLGAIIFVILFGATLDTILFGYFAGTLAGAILILVNSKKARPQPAIESRIDNTSLVAVRKRIWLFMIPLLPLALVSWLTAFADRFVLAHVVDMESVGLYAAAYGLASRPIFAAGGAIELVARPIYFKSVVNGLGDRSKRVFRAWVLSVATISFVGVVCFYFLRNFVANLLLAEEYRSAAELLPWLAAGFAFLQIAQVFENKIRGNERTDLVLLMYVLVAVTTIGSTYLLGSEWGIFGVVYSCPIYYLAFATIGSFLSRYEKHIDSIETVRSHLGGNLDSENKVSTT
jgi:O-antigen/teichoic acid export membrane protein